jgi:hypothetical protein
MDGLQELGQESKAHVLTLCASLRYRGSIGRPLGDPLFASLCCIHRVIYIEGSLLMCDTCVVTNKGNDDSDGQHDYCQYIRIQYFLSLLSRFRAFRCVDEV